GRSGAQRQHRAQRTPPFVALLRNRARGVYLCGGVLTTPPWQPQAEAIIMPNLTVTLGRLKLKNPILVASGTFGYAREMAGVVEFAKLGGIIPKTVTRQPRAGNPPPRTVESPSGMLNAIGLDNDGIDHFIAHHLPYLRTLPTAIIANIAGKNENE